MAYAIEFLKGRFWYVTRYKECFYSIQREVRNQKTIKNEQVAMWKLLVIINLRIYIYLIF